MYALANRWEGTLLPVKQCSLVFIRSTLVAADRCIIHSYALLYMSVHILCLRIGRKNFSLLTDIKLTEDQCCNLKIFILMHMS